MRPLLGIVAITSIGAFSVRLQIKLNIFLNALRWLCCSILSLSVVITAVLLNVLPPTLPDWSHIKSNNQSAPNHLDLLSNCRGAELLSSTKWRYLSQVNQ